MTAFDEIVNALQTRAEIKNRLSLIPYEGTPEIKNQEYLYVRKRVGNSVKSSYIGTYSDELYQLLLKNTHEARGLRKELRKIEKTLAELGYQEKELSPRVTSNLDFAKANLKSIIFDQAVLEGINVSYSQVEDIMEDRKIRNIKPSDISKIWSLKQAWEFILNPKIIQVKRDYGLLCCIARLVNEGFCFEGGRIRGVPVTIGGSSYIPPIPIESDVKENIDTILQSNEEDIDKSIDLCLYTMKTQVFIDGNKRAAVIFANHYLIAHGQGLLVIPESQVPEFKKLLVSYYEGKGEDKIRVFFKEKCWQKF